MVSGFSDFVSSNNPKFDEILSKTRDVAETVGKKSVEHLELSRKRIEYLDAKSKLTKLYEKYGMLQYAAYVGEPYDEDELEQTAQRISANKKKLDDLKEEIKAAKAKFAESVQRTKEAIQKEVERATAPKTEVDVTDFFETEDDLEDAENVQADE